MCLIQKKRWKGACCNDALQLHGETGGGVLETLLRVVFSRGLGCGLRDAAGVLTGSGRDHRSEHFGNETGAMTKWDGVGGARQRPTG